MEAVVIAAGEGRRMRPLTEHWPKPALPIDGKPVLVSVLRDLEAAGVERSTVVVGHLGDQIRRLLAGLDVRLAEQRKPLGSADAVRHAVEAGATPPFIVAAGDTLYADGDLRRFVEAWDHPHAAGAHAPPLWGLGPEVAALLDELPGPPYELQEAFRRAVKQGHEVVPVELGPTRDLTEPADVVRHNFVYLED